MDGCIRRGFGENVVWVPKLPRDIEKGLSEETAIGAIFHSLPDGAKLCGVYRMDPRVSMGFYVCTILRGSDTFVVVLAVHSFWGNNYMQKRGKRTLRIRIDSCDIVKDTGGSSGPRAGVSEEKRIALAMGVSRSAESPLRHLEGDVWSIVWGMVTKPVPCAHCGGLECGI
jgi:hypothetical protein